MAVESQVSYPLFFEDRQEDRAMVADLVSQGVDPNVAAFMLYRIWKEFAHGKSDRRVVDPSNLAADRSVLMIEQFCKWSGTRGGLVSAAIAAGFLRLESVAGGGTLLVCHGFRENNNRATSMQSRGGLGRALKTHQREAAAAAEEREKLWSRTGGGAFKEIPAEQRREAIVFIVLVCRALGRPIPADAALTDGTFHLAIEIIRDHSEESRKAVLMWLLPNRGDASIPERIDMVLRAWPEYVTKSAAQ
jgi:hypothetical protein